MSMYFFCNKKEKERLYDIEWRGYFVFWEFRFFSRGWGVEVKGIGWSG